MIKLVKGPVKGDGEEECDARLQGNKHTHIDSHRAGKGGAKGALARDDIPMRTEQATRPFSSSLQLAL